MADEKELMKFKPQHPLPDEVRKMNRDETVCKFCGVSYLIHNEIKALEDKVKALEEQLIHFQGSERREEDLRNQLNKAHNEQQKLQDDITGQEAVINTLKVELSCKTQELSQVESSRKQITEKLQYMSAACEQYKLKHGLLCANLPTIQAALGQQKAVLSSIREEMQKKDQLLVQETQDLSRHVQVVCTAQIAESVSMRAKLHDLENERLSFKFKEEKYVSEIKSAEKQLAKLESTAQDAEKLAERCQQLELRNSELEKDSSSQQDQYRQISLESKQYQDQLKRFAEQMEQQQSLGRNKDMAAEQTRARLEKDLRDKDSELQTILRELGRMKTKLVEQQEELQKKSSLSTMRTQEMSEQLERCRGDLEALKQERELMITAHQNQIEQLRESFKKKIADTDRWQEKLDEMLQKERDKHKSEVSVIEQKLKENFVYEMQIEKQKLQEIHEKRLSSLREEEETLRNKLETIESKHRSEVSELHKQLAENKARARETENTLRQEIVSLKKIIADLEQRLGRLDSGSDQKVGEMKTEVKRLQHELGETREESQKVKTQLSSAKEEIGFLQDTVRRECEERFELTETLSQMKEDLLQYKRPPGGYSQASVRSVSSSVQRPVKSPDHQSSSVTSPSSEEVMLFRKVSRPQPTPPSSVHTEPSVENKDMTSASSIQLGYGGESARSGGGGATVGRGIRGGSLKDSRRRIAEAVGRK